MNDIEFIKVEKKYLSSKKNVLENINFSIKKGERVGIVGENGSGKSTLLKLIAGDLIPSSGKIFVNSPVECLFNSEIFSNPYISSYNIAKEYALLKDFKGNLKEKIESIENFCQLDKRFYDPFYTLSLGMKARVQFAVKTAFYKQIVLVDEVLGAGDITTTNRSANRIKAIANNSTFICVSHSLGQIREFCERSLWIKNGNIYLDSFTDDVIERYEKFMQDKIKNTYSLDFKSINKNTDKELAKIKNKQYLLDVFIDWLKKNEEKLGIKKEIKESNEFLNIFCYSKDCFSSINEKIKIIESFIAVSIEKNIILKSNTRNKVNSQLNSLSDGFWIVAFNIYSQEYKTLYFFINILKTNHSDPPLLLLPGEVKNNLNENLKIWQSSEC